MGDQTGPMEKIAWLVTVLLFIVIMLLIFKNSFDIWNKAYTPQECRRYIELSSGLGNFDNIKCSIQDIEIDKKEDINEKIANAMTICNWQYGAGKIPLFDSAVTKEERFCAPCSFIEFKEEAAGHKISDFRVYLSKEKPPIKYKADTYYEYLTGKKPGDIEPGLETEIDTDKLHSIMFVYVKDSKIETIFFLYQNGYRLALNYQ